MKAQEIADRFCISLRTVYRDIRALEEGGVPIGAEAGIGYFLEESYALPPVMFTTDEASALLMAGKLIPHMSDKKVDTAFQEALFKIKAVMKAEDKDRLDKLENSVKVYTGLSEIPQQDSIFIQDIQKALVESKVLQIKYYAQYSQQSTARQIEPVCLLFYAMNWHLVAYCKLRNDYRDFRLDRIQDLKITDQIFDKKPDQEFENYMKRQQEANQSHEITLQVEKELAQWIHESKYWYGFVSQKQTKKGFEMKFLNPDLHGFARWIITMIDQVQIIEPKELHEIVKDMVLKLCRQYQ